MARRAIPIVAFVAAGVFGIILLADGDWLPGAIIVAAALVGLTAQTSIIRRRGG